VSSVAFSWKCCRQHGLADAENKWTQAPMADLKDPCALTPHHVLSPTELAVSCTSVHFCLFLMWGCNFTLHRQTPLKIHRRHRENGSNLRLDIYCKCAERPNESSHHFCQGLFNSFFFCVSPLGLFELCHDRLWWGRRLYSFIISWWETHNVIQHLRNVLVSRKYHLYLRRNVNYHRK